MYVRSSLIHLSGINRNTGHGECPRDFLLEINHWLNDYSHRNVSEVEYKEKAHRNETSLISQPFALPCWTIERANENVREKGKGR